jgi:hypothetical protein
MSKQAMSREGSYWSLQTQSQATPNKKQTNKQTNRLNVQLLPANAYGYETSEGSFKLSQNPSIHLHQFTLGRNILKLVTPYFSALLHHCTHLRFLLLKVVHILFPSNGLHFLPI